MWYASVISPQNTEALHTEIICVPVNSQNTKPCSTTQLQMSDVEHRLTPGSEGSVRCVPGCSPHPTGDTGTGHRTTRTRQASASPAPGNRALGNAFVRRVTSLARKRKYPNQVQYWSASFQNQDVARRNPVSSWADRRQGWAVLTSWVRWTFW